MSHFQIVTLVCMGQNVSWTGSCVHFISIFKQQLAGEYMRVVTMCLWTQSDQQFESVCLDQLIHWQRFN